MIASPSSRNVPHNARLHAMLYGAIVSTLCGLAWPNILMMLSQSSTVLVETYFLAKLGTDALAGAALVVPVLMLTQNMSQGAMGGGISSAIARALGAGRNAEADELVLQAVLLNGGLGLVFTAAILLLGPNIYTWMGAYKGARTAALQYSNVVALGLVFMWVMNALASVIRGTGNMMVPGTIIVGGALLLIPLSPLLIFGLGPVPAMGMAGAGLAMDFYYGVGATLLAWYCISGRNVARLKPGLTRWPLMRRILSVGALATFNPLLTNVLIAATTALVGGTAGTAALAGYGTGARVEYLVIPIAFGIGAPMVAMVGSNIGAGQTRRALHIALTGGALAFVLSETVGLAAAFWPDAWMNLFTSDPNAVSAGAAFLRRTGPFLGFYGLGLSLYFASQGAGKLKWPLLAGATRLVAAAGGGYIVYRAGGTLGSLFIAGAAGMFLYGMISAAAIASGVWFPKARLTNILRLRRTA